MRRLDLQLMTGCFWCGREDSNFHGLPHSDLNAARLPIPPRPHVVEAVTGAPHVPNHLLRDKGLWRFFVRGSAPDQAGQTERLSMALALV